MSAPQHNELSKKEINALLTLSLLYGTTPSKIHAAIMLHAGVGLLPHSEAWNEAKRTLSNIK